jgi:hypothetical protein
MLPRYFLLFTPLVNAWTFRYTNMTDETIITRGNEERNCTIANIAAEKLFTFDPEGTNQCVSIYRDTTCDSMGGYSCTSWRKNASRTFMAFDIMPENLIIAKSQTSTMASTSTPTSTSASSSTAASTSISSAASSPTITPSDAAATATDGGSSTGLSGGAIAGVVIGVVAAVAIVVGLVILFLKRKNKKNAPTTAPGGYGPHEADATGSSMSGTTVKEPLASVGFRPAPGSKLVELKGDEGSAELGSSPISELDGGDHQTRRF